MVTDIDTIRASIIGTIGGYCEILGLASIYGIETPPNIYMMLGSMVHRFEEIREKNEKDILKGCPIERVEILNYLSPMYFGLGLNIHNEFYDRYRKTEFTEQDWDLVRDMFISYINYALHRDINKYINLIFLNDRNPLYRATQEFEVVYKYKGYNIIGHIDSLRGIKYNDITEYIILDHNVVNKLFWALPMYKVIQLDIYSWLLYNCHNILVYSSVINQISHFNNIWFEFYRWFTPRMERGIKVIDRTIDLIEGKKKPKKLKSNDYRCKICINRTICHKTI